MKSIHNTATYLPQSAHLCGEDYAHWKYFWHAITSAKRCYRTCAHPPAVCLLRLLFTVSKVSICLLVFQFPSLFIWVLLFRDFPFLSFSLSSVKQKSCSCPFCLEHCWLFPTVDALKLFTSAVFLAGQCSAVFSSQYPYF